ncbi:phosphotransferase [Stenotrophomonas sp. 24(2023)]|uniref:phosphotransferase enzyme family protein n=1 Tax=Stenotrophomonas sp. 24(2023) TaxID=3068324 RepID=UPI0027DFECC4|nr:phosphotransferase [Stenotrophomonas sp. 24(2023)]WMJ71229.1 phosphotransferase [Stenotrophomonas sp. 24(2023)]
MSVSSHRVQGLNNDSVAADWPPITAAELAGLQADYPQLAGNCRLLWHSPRPLSAAAIVEAAAGRVFIKRHHQRVRSVQTLGEEHRFIAHLGAQGLPVVRVLHDAHGASAVAHGEWTYELHALGEGHDVYRDAHSWTLVGDVAQAREAGRMLARLHQAAAGYDAPQRTTHILVARDALIRSADPLALLAASLPARPGLARYLARQPWQQQLQRTVLPWHAALGTRLQAEPTLWAHNDWHVSNLLWRQDGAVPQVQTVFDFGLASPTSALFDLATAIERNAIAWLELERGDQAVRTDIALALVEGYQQVLPLAPERVALLADLLPVVHFDFALSEVEYFEGVTGSTANADVAYHTFLLGHAQWFAGEIGQRLLAALRGAG